MWQGPQRTGRESGRGKADTGAHPWPWGRDGPGAPGSAPPSMGCTHMGGDLLQLSQRHLVIRGTDISPEVIILRHCDLEVKASVDPDLLPGPSPQSTAAPLPHVGQPLLQLQDLCGLLLHSLRPQQAEQALHEHPVCCQDLHKEGTVQGRGSVSGPSPTLPEPHAIPAIPSQAPTPSHSPHPELSTGSSRAE